MSTSIYVNCEECEHVLEDGEDKAQYDPDARLYWSDNLWELVKIMPKLQEALLALHSDDCYIVELVPDYWASNKYGLTEFVAVHGKHKLAVYDEYGRLVERPLDK